MFVDVTLQFQEQIDCLLTPKFQEQLECKGGHEISTVKCSEAAPYSCLRPCGRLLPCGNHTCEKECHDPGEGYVFLTTTSLQFT